MKIFLSKKTDVQSRMIVTPVFLVLGNNPDFFLELFYRAIEQLRSESTIVLIFLQ